MLLTGLAGWLGALLAGSVVPPAPAEGVRVMTVEERMIFRIPVAPRPRPRFKVEWDEEKGPRCVPAGALVGAFLSGSDSIDFLLRGRHLVRARLDNDCAGLDFYGGFYIQPEDGMLCAKRDSIRSRVGGTCRIEKFRSLVPKIER